MIKASAKTADGTHLLVLGLSEGNLQKLRKGEPIYFNTEQLRIPKTETIGKVVIFYGATEEECFNTMKAMVGVNTEVISIPKGSSQPT